MEKRVSKFIHVTERTKEDVLKYAIKHWAGRKKNFSHGLAHANQDSNLKKMACRVVKVRY